MSSARPLKVGITCYPTVGGSGILAAELGQELAKRGHEVHFISYERPFRVAGNEPRVFFHPVVVNDYNLFKYPDYTLPLSVKMAEVTRDHGLDLLHVHYAVPHATAAILAQSMLPAASRPKLITTLHGTDTTLLGQDPGYRPAIQHALECSDAITTVSEFLRQETMRLLPVSRPIEVIHNFFEPDQPARSREEVRRELGVGNETLVIHASNLRPLKRIDLLLETAARIRPRESFKLVILAGADFAPFAKDVQRLGLADRVIVREKVSAIEDYLQAADLALFTSEMESFCLSILEAMNFARPSVSTSVGGIPEVVQHGVSGLLVPGSDPDALARAVESLVSDPARRAALGTAAQKRAREFFSADVIVPRYEQLYRRVCPPPSSPSRTVLIPSSLL
ncbi:MAG TPA: N-acetyl-alpha-D-glucosaminyl L-malate synthase BshA [Opitutaceae bacterium]|nr:N-acetyl-alpha-D-glucosaminyl L-malate synthase BshA [Opitutaceae bacterium]